MALDAIPLRDADTWPSGGRGGW